MNTNSSTIRVNEKRLTAIAIEEEKIQIREAESY